uniref:Uncharacterized protein n=1 Tax=Rhizophora mucronata TaxID=61149 RepID=A0A2P2PUA7_RHIMU
MRQMEMCLRFQPERKY